MTKDKREEITAQDIEQEIEQKGFAIYTNLNKKVLQEYRDKHIGMASPIGLKKEIIIYKKEFADKVVEILIDNEPRFKNLKEILSSEQYTECDLDVGLWAHELLTGIKCKPTKKGKCIAYVDEPINPSDLYKKIVGKYAKKEFEKEKPVIVVIPDNIKAIAEEFSKDINKFEILSYVFGLMHVGNKQEIICMYLNVQESTTKQTTNVLVKGPSTAGKTHATNCVLKLFPNEWVYKIGDTTERGLYYLDADKANRPILYIQEMKFGDETTHALKLQSSDDGGFKILSTVKDPDTNEFVAREREIRSKMFISTSTRAIDQELDTRTVVYPFYDDESITRQVLDRKGISEENGITFDNEVLKSDTFKAIEHYITTIPYESDVIIPFGTELSRNLPETNTRIRRDIDKIFGLIKGMARFDYKNRVCLPDNEHPQIIIASINDYKMALELFSNTLKNTLQKIDDVDRSILDTIDKLNADNAIIKDANGNIDVGKTTYKATINAIYDALGKDGTDSINISKATINSRLVGYKDNKTGQYRGGLYKKGYTDRKDVGIGRVEYAYFVTELPDLSGFNPIKTDIKSDILAKLPSVIKRCLTTRFNGFKGDRGVEEITNNAVESYKELEERLRDQKILSNNDTPLTLKSLKSDQILMFLQTLLADLNSKINRDKSALNGSEEMPADPFYKG